MKVLYDYQIFKMQKFGGIPRYFYKLCKYNNKLWDYEVQANYLDNIYLSEISRNKKLIIPFPYKHQFIAKYNTFDLNNKLVKQDFDLYHPTYYYYDKPNIRKPTILTVHDFIHELFPHLFIQDNVTVKAKKKSVYEADRIIAISQNTKNDLLKFYPDIPEDKIDIVYHAIEWIPNEKHELSQIINKPYILFTGQRWAYKNFISFSKAVAPLLKKYDLYLVCTGTTFTEQENQLLQDLDIIERTFVYFAEENELKALYENAICFVFPSLYEGFGLPILEAFASNCPIAISNTSCFPEIAQDAAVYFDPKSESDMRKKIENLITSESLRNNLIKNGKQRIRFFSMENFVTNTYNVYKKTINNYR